MSLELEAAAALRQVALAEDVKAYVLQHPALYRALLRAALRFIAGETLEECVAVARRLNHDGFAVTIDYVGESARATETANEATRSFHAAIEEIAKQGLDASISLDLSHLGMLIDPQRGLENARSLAETARQAGLDMMISMEGSDRTDQILELHERLCERFDNVGITLQARLHRTPRDLAAVLERPGRIRLVKGAYEASAEVALPWGQALNAMYREMLDTLLQSRHACSIATHDSALLEHARRRIEEWGLPRGSIEFEMLKGVATDLHEGARARGDRTRIYLPYGREWHLYLCNRLAEHPPSIYQVLVDAVGGAGARV